MDSRLKLSDWRNALHLSQPGRWPHIYLAAGCALIISILVASYMQAALGLNALSSLDLLNRRTDQLDQITKLIIDAETGVRGFQLTDDPAYLEPYLNSVPKIAETIVALRKDYAQGTDEDKDVEVIVTLVNKKLEILGEAVNRKDSKDIVDRRQLEFGKRVMDELRKQVQDMKDSLALEGKASVNQSISGFQKTRIATILLAIGALVLLIVLFALFQRQQQLRDRITQLLKDENDLLDRQVQERTDELAKLATYLTNVREAEKLRLARELHDELGALLTAAKMDAGWVERKLPADMKAQMGERLARLQDNLSNGIALKRRITNDLRPALLYDLGLVSSLRVLAEEFERTDEVKVDLSLPDADVTLPDATALALFRIVQEALTNIRKYAQAKKVVLDLSLSEGRVQLIVADDGIGFDTRSPTLARHGLAGMKHRVQMLSGSIRLESAPGSGTRIMVEAPIPSGGQKEGRKQA